MDLHRAQEFVRSMGCYHINIHGVPKVQRVGDYIYEMSNDEESKRTQQAKFFKEFCGGEALKILEQNPYLKKQMGFPQEWLDLAYETNPLNLPMAIYVGFDLCGKNFVINDLNSDRAIVAGYQPEIAMAFHEQDPEKNFRSFYDGLHNAFKLYTGKDNPRVFVLRDVEDPHIHAFESFTKRKNYSLGSIDDFNPSEVDIVFRTIRTHDTILQDNGKYRKLINALKGGLPMINPIGAAIAGHKGWVPYLTHTGLVNASWFPESFLVSSEDLITCSDGTTKNKDWVTEVLLPNRNDFIVKNVFSAGGRKVTRGSEYKFKEWKSLWEEAFKINTPMLVEKKQDRFLRRISIIDDDNKIREKELNLLQRVYTIQGTDEIYSELFGGESWKVNASGHAFPVHFSLV